MASLSSLAPAVRKYWIIWSVNNRIRIRIDNEQLTFIVKVKVTQSCPTLCNPMDYTAHRILQARILEWVAVPFSRGSSQPRDWTQVSRIVGDFFTSWATRKPTREATREALNLYKQLQCVWHCPTCATCIMSFVSENNPMGQVLQWLLFSRWRSRCWEVSQIVQPHVVTWARASLWKQPGYAHRPHLNPLHTLPSECFVLFCFDLIVFTFVFSFKPIWCRF